MQGKYRLWILSGLLVLTAVLLMGCTAKNNDMETKEGTLTYSISQARDHSVLVVKDDRGNELYSDTFETSYEPMVSVIDQDTIEIVYGKGDWHQSIFVNGKTGQVSPAIDDVLASNGKLAVHAGFIDGQMKIIIQDIYDEEKGYEEIIDDFPPVAVGKHVVKDVTFLDDGRIEISYYTGQDAQADGWREKTVTISIP